MDETAKAIAEKYGVTDKLNELESRILENRYATSVEFDISGFTDKIYQVIMFEELEIGTDALAEKYGIEFPPDRPKKEPQPEHFAISQYRKFKMAAGKTLKSILITAGVRLSPFDVKEVREMTRYDEMELGTMGDKKTMLFIIIDDKVSTYNFLANMMYCQLFKELCDKADTVYGGRLPVHVRFLIDEFANVGQIPNFEKIISVIRSREISVSVIVQNLAQIESL